MKVVGKEWQAMSYEQKQKYEELSRLDKERYMTQT